MIAPRQHQVVDLEQSSDCQVIRQTPITLAVQSPISIPMQIPIPIPVQNLCGFIRHNCRFSSPIQFIPIFNKLRIPTKLNYSAQRYMYELALAIVTILIQKKEEAVCLATLLLQNFCHKQKDGYWQILHYLVDLKESIETPTEEIYTKIILPTITEGSNLQHKYHCHCEATIVKNACFQKRQELVNATEVAHQIERCPYCQQFFHPYCQTQGLLCNRCYLSNADTETRSIRSFICSYLHNSNYLTCVRFKCPDGLQAKLQNSSSFMLNMKICLNGEQIPEGYNFFKHYALYLNQQPLDRAFKQTRLGLICIKIPIKYLEETNIVVIQKIEKQSDPPLFEKRMLERPFMLGVYQVVQKSVKKSPMRNSVITVGLQSMKKLYAFLNRKHHQISKVKIRMHVPLDHQYLPVRSLECLHFECFNYYELMQSRLPKTGRTCPLCHKSINTIYVDTVIQESLLNHKSWGRSKDSPKNTSKRKSSCGSKDKTGDGHENKVVKHPKHIQIQFGLDYNVISIWPLDCRNEIVLD